MVALPATVRDGVASCALGALRLPPGAAVDGAATVVVRPEQIALDGPDDGVAALVAGVEYFGHDAIVALELDGRPAGEHAVRARCAGYAVPTVGDRVRLAVHGEVGVDQS